jgi:RNA 2',3'-cyclic 3'-phosphodiesterase
MPDEILRTFIAIELDEMLRIAIGRVQGKLKRAAPAGGVKWVASDSIHLTLKFLGDTPRSRISQVEAALQVACAAYAPFEFNVEGRGCFPNFHRPRVIWVAVRDKGQTLARLQKDVERHVAPLGWPTEERGFSPHLTLGRIAKGADRATEEEIGQIVERSVVEQIGVQRVTAVSLIQSDLRPAGPVYTRLLNVALEPRVEGETKPPE